jgi:hypothetical protein
VREEEENYVAFVKPEEDQKFFGQNIVLLINHVASQSPNRFPLSLVISTEFV